MLPEVPSNKDIPCTIVSETDITDITYNQRYTLPEMLLIVYGIRDTHCQGLYQ